MGLHKILEIFPTPVYIQDITDDVDKIETLLLSQEIETSVEANVFGNKSKDSYILDREEFSEIKSILLSKVKSFATDVLNYDYDEYRLTQSWISAKLPGQRHSMHSHQNSLISGVFFYGEAYSNTPAITFHKDIFATNCYSLKPAQNHSAPRNKFNADQFFIDFNPGTLVMFPSYLQHSVPVNQTKTTRYSLAFNAIPKKSLGTEYELTELKF